MSEVNAFLELRIVSNRIQVKNLNLAFLTMILSRRSFIVIIPFKILLASSQCWPPKDKCMLPKRYFRHIGPLYSRGFSALCLTCFVIWGELACFIIMKFRRKNVTAAAFLFFAGHQSFMAPSCSVLHCPAACTCSNNIVDCRGKGLTEIPTNLPETITEMYVP